MYDLNHKLNNYEIGHFLDHNIYHKKNNIDDIFVFHFLNNILEDLYNIL